MITFKITLIPKKLDSVLKYHMNEQTVEVLEAKSEPLDYWLKVTSFTPGYITPNHNNQSHNYIKDYVDTKETRFSFEVSHARTDGRGIGSEI